MNTLFVSIAFISFSTLFSFSAAQNVQEVREASESRKLLEIPKAIDFYSRQCESHCGMNGDNQSLMLNSCEKCTDKFSPCNFCCHEASSSLRMKWHGCKGIVTLEQEEDGYCHLKQDRESESSQAASFISCGCYETFLQSGYLDDGCQLSRALFVSDDDPSICIVSTNENGAMDLTLPLPNPLKIVHKIVDSNDEMRPDWNRDIITVLETKCGADTAPIFPGYGVFGGTCPMDGSIDLGLSEVTLPPSIDYYFGEPPAEMFWYEFIDGTSTGFWPSTGEPFLGIDSKYFRPTFDTCDALNVPVLNPQEHLLYRHRLSPHYHLLLLRFRRQYHLLSEL